MRSTFSVLFYLKRKDVRKDGSVPVMGRITIDGGKPAQFSCKMTVDPSLWNTETGRMTGRSIAAQETNKMLDGIRVKINHHYREIMDRDGFVTAEKVKNAFLGLEYRHETLMKVYDQFNSDFDKMVKAGMRAKPTQQKYLAVYDHLKRFLETRYHVSDIALKEIAPAFINDFEMYLRTENRCSHNTVWVYLMPLRKMISIAIENGWLLRDPFIKHEIGMEETERTFLTNEELKKLMDMRFKKPKHELVRDLFVFCCFTGLAFSDVSTLTADMIVTDADSEQWIRKHREKTDELSSIPLLEIPRQILAKYSGHKKINGTGRLLPVLSNQRCNGYLKEIADLAGIPKKLTTHVARHTFACMSLDNHVSIETISKMLGHANIKTTQTYAKMQDKTISEDMVKMRRKFDSVVMA